jgi:hypothetical protein
MDPDRPAGHSEDQADRATNPPGRPGHKDCLCKFASWSRHLKARRLTGDRETLGVFLNVTVLQNDQKAPPARPQRVKNRSVPLRYVEDLNDARTLLGGFFNILLGLWVGYRSKASQLMHYH